MEVNVQMNWGLGENECAMNKGCCFFFFILTSFQLCF